VAEEIVGKSSGYVGPVEDYTPNEGSVGRRKITFLGASCKFAHRVFRDMLRVDGPRVLSHTPHVLPRLTWATSCGSRCCRLQ